MDYAYQCYNRVLLHSWTVQRYKRRCIVRRSIIILSFFLLFVPVSLSVSSFHKSSDDEAERKLFEGGSCRGPLLERRLKRLELPIVGLKIELEDLEARWNFLAISQTHSLIFQVQGSSITRTWTQFFFRSLSSSLTTEPALHRSPFVQFPAVVPARLASWVGTSIVSLVWAPEILGYGCHRHLDGQFRTGERDFSS